MDVKMTQAQKFAKAREQAKAQFVNFGEAEAFQVGVDTFAVETEFGWVTIKVQAVKDAEFDAKGEAEAFWFEQEQKRVEKANKDAEKKMKADMRAKEKAKNAKVEKA